MVEWNHPPGPPGIIFVAGDSSQPLLHRVFANVLRVDLSGVLETRVHPHRMVTGLERLDASTEKDLQQVHTSHSVADKLDDPLDQHLHLRLLFRVHSQGGGLLHSSQGKGGKSSRLARSWLVLTVKPGRLPSPDRVGKDHSWEGALVPHLDSKDPRTSVSRASSRHSGWPS